MACIIYTTKPAVSERLVMRGLMSWVIASSYIQWCIFLIEAYLQVIDFYVCWFYCLLRSLVLRTRRIAQSVVYRLHDPKIVGSILDSTQKIFFPQKMLEIIFIIMVPIGNNHILSESPLLATACFARRGLCHRLAVINIYLYTFICLVR